MECKHCNKSIADDAVFCSYCGRKVTHKRGDSYIACNHCRNIIPGNSVYCMFCGRKIEKNNADEKDITVPAPHKLASGKYTAQMMVNGQRVSVPPQDTKKAYEAAAKAIKIDLLNMQKRDNRTIGTVIDEYIKANTAVLSPSTIRGYKAYRRQLSDYADCIIADTDFQSLINDLAKGNGDDTGYSPKSIRNLWGLIARSLTNARISYPKINLPDCPKNEHNYLEFDQIPVFLDAIKGLPCELPAILALHSLRLSEILALKADSFDVTSRIIKVRGARVPDATGALVYKAQNKNKTSTRDVPFLIPRLTELITDLPKSGYIYNESEKYLYDSINRVCRKAGLPQVGVHGLRHTFASLAYHLNWKVEKTQSVGGWKNPDVLMEIYTHLSVRDINADVENMRNYFEDTSPTE